MALRKFIIERNIPKVGSFDGKQLSEAANRTRCCAGSGRRIFSGLKVMWRTTGPFAFIWPRTRTPSGGTPK